MRRRTFLSIAAAAAPLISSCSRGVVDGPASLVDTPEKRRRYLLSLLDDICSLGPRPIGSPAMRKSARIVLKQMERSLPEAELDPFTFENWTLKGEPELSIGGTSVETYPAHGSSGTSPEGLRGVLREDGSGKGTPFVVLDPSSRRPVAWLSESEYGRAVPLPWYSFDREFRCPPIFNIGRQDIGLAREAVEHGLPVFLRAEVEFVPDTGCVNVVGSLPGETDEEILFIAHLDTVYNSPGANDNTASVIAMLMLAHAFDGVPQRRRMTFLATSGEEYDKTGAVAYAERRKREGTYDRIKYLVNVDSATWGPNMQINTLDNALWEMIRDIDTQLELPGEPVWAGQDGFSLDGRPFRETGARAMYVNSRGYELTHLWHRPEDTPETVPTDCAEIFFRLMSEYLQRLQAL